MKNNYFKHYYKFGFLFLFAMLFTFGCRKELTTDTPSAISTEPISDAELIANAKSFFQKTVKNELNSKSKVADLSGGYSKNNDKVIDWNTAYTENISLGKIVMLPVQYKNSPYVEIGGRELPLSSLTRLFIYSGKKSDHIELVIRIPDEDYLNNTQLNKPFTGIVEVDDWQGNFIKAYLYKNGSVTRLGPPSFNKTNNDSKIQQSKRTNDITCYPIPYGHCVTAGGETDCFVDGYNYYCSGSGGGGNNEEGPDPHDYGGGGGGSGTGPGDAGPTISNQDIQQAVPFLEGPPPINPQKYVNCFSDGKTASQYIMTIYVDQPKQGQNDTWSLYSYGGQRYTAQNGYVFNVGHTFVGFTKINTDGTSVTQVMGFYPGGNKVRSDGVIKDDGGHGYSLSYTETVSAARFNVALQLVIDNGNLADYQLSNISGVNEYNCTDAAVIWMESANTNIPHGTAHGYFNRSPGYYGQELRNTSGVNTTPGYAPASHGPCN